MNRTRALIFIFLVFLSLTIIPVINLVELGTAQNKDEKQWWSRSVLFSLDFVLPYVSRFFYSFGVSTDPNQVIIGKGNWLYLGDLYEKTITVRRRGATAEDVQNVKEIVHATDLWEKWLKRKGVRQYQIMLGPNKGTIYPEFLPVWARPSDANSATNLLLANVSHELYVDTRSVLSAAKSQFAEPLYYQTDTHWNSLGAWVAFRSFTTAFDRKEHGLYWLSDNQVHISTVIDRKGGDLANFLRMGKMLQDTEVVIKIDVLQPIETEQYDFETAHLIVSGGNPPVGAPQHPLLVKSKNALNHKRVLWLRDSFGTAMAPFMAATFTEIIQLHYSVADPVLLAKLIDTFKPDYVFLTVVERSALGRWFTTHPPEVFTSKKRKDFILISQGKQSGINDLNKIEGATGFRISGADPFIIFSLLDPIRPDDASHIAFELNCGGKDDLRQIQVFWHGADTVFNEIDSVRFTANPGITEVDLSAVSAWTQAGTITDLRIDLDSQSDCPVLEIRNVELGK